jgi:ribose 5-phosphate isomerase A
MSSRDQEKQAAARAAVALVEDGMRLGLGSGSTALHAVRFLGERVRQGLRVVGVPTSRETARAAREAGIELDGLDSEPRLDLTIDGTDEVDSALRLIKGGGGALLHEKIVAAASDRMVVVADGSKAVERLGAFPLPVEVVPFALPLVRRLVAGLGVEGRVRLTGDGEPFTTDEGNRILDCPFGSIEDPEALATALEATPGVVEHGLFLGLADEVLIARGEDVERLVAAT